MPLIRNATQPFYVLSEEPCLYVFICHTTHNRYNAALKRENKKNREGRFFAKRPAGVPGPDQTRPEQTIHVIVDGLKVSK